MPQNETDDLEACQVPVPEVSSTTCSSDRVFETSKPCVVALQYLDRSCYLTIVDIVEREDHNLVFNSIPIQLDQILAERWSHKFLVKAFVKNVVGVAEVQQVD